MLNYLLHIFIDFSNARLYYNHSQMFCGCFTIFMYIAIILAIMLKSEILMPENSMCPILSLSKNYLELRNYLEVPMARQCW